MKMVWSKDYYSSFSLCMLSLRSMAAQGGGGGGVRQFFIFTVSKTYQNVCTVDEKLSVLHSILKKWSIHKNRKRLSWNREN